MVKYIVCTCASVLLLFSHTSMNQNLYIHFKVDEPLVAESLTSCVVDFGWQTNIRAIYSKGKLLANNFPTQPYLYVLKINYADSLHFSQPFFLDESDNNYFTLSVHLFQNSDTIKCLVKSSNNDLNFNNNLRSYAEDSLKLEEYYLQLIRNNR